MRLPRARRRSGPGAGRSTPATRRFPASSGTPSAGPHRRATRGTRHQVRPARIPRRNAPRPRWKRGFRAGDAGRPEAKCLRTFGAPAPGARHPRGLAGLRTWARDGRLRPPPCQPEAPGRPDRRAARIHSGLTGRIRTNVGILLACAAVAALLLLYFLWRERRLRRRRVLLVDIMDLADAPERALLECRARLRHVPALAA